MLEVPRLKRPDRDPSMDLAGGVWRIGPDSQGHIAVSHRPASRIPSSADMLIIYVLDHVNAIR